MCPFVSIIIPNFNGGEFIAEAVSSILDIDYPAERFEIIIVDNHSSDGSLEKLKVKFAPEILVKKIKLFENNSNIGAPAAYNLAIKNADKNYNYILKLDNDIILAKNALSELIKCAESDPLIGMVGGKVFYFSDKKRLHLIGSKISPFYGGSIGIGKYKLDSDKYNRNLELDAVNGCMMAVKRRLIELIGIMDENYFLYFDDLDWALRARRQGFKSVYCHKAVAFHNTSKPYKRFQNKRWLYYAVYNSFYFMKKNYSGIDSFIFLISVHIRILYYLLGMFLNNSISGQFELLGVISKSYIEGIRSLCKKESSL